MARFERPLHELTRIAAATDVPVQKIPAGVRGRAQRETTKLSATASKAKTGRPPKEGERYPSGKLKTGMGPALWNRIKTNAIRLGEDVRLGSELARLSLFGQLTAAQTAAGFRMAEIYGRFERMRGLRRTSKSAAYDIGHGDPDLAEDRMTQAERERLVERQQAVLAEFEDLQEELPVYPPRARATLEALVIEDRPLNGASLAEAIVLLDRLVIHFGAKWRNQKPGPGKPERPRPQPKAAKVERAQDPPIETPARIAHRMAMRRLRPDLDDDAIDEAWKLQSQLEAAISDRARFRREKG